MFKKIKEWLDYRYERSGLTHPEKYCPIYSEKLKEALLDKNTKYERCGHALKINDTEVWIANYPYAFGNVYRNCSEFTIEGKVFPGLTVRKMLKAKVDELYSLDVNDLFKPDKKKAKKNANR